MKSAPTACCLRNGLLLLSCVTTLQPAQAAIITIMGDGIPLFSGDGGLAIDAQVGSPSGLAFGSDSNLYIADTGNHVVRRIDVSGIVTTFAGTPQTMGDSGDGGLATAATFNSPTALDLDSSGSLYILQQTFNRVRVVDSLGAIDAFAGNGTFGPAGDGGPALAAQLAAPAGIAVRPGSENLIIADTANATLREVNSLTGNINLLAGNGFPFISGDGGPAINAGLGQPSAVTATASGDTYLLSQGGPGGTLLRKIDGNTGIITTVAGGGLSTADSGFGADILLGTTADPANALVADGDDLLIGGKSKLWRFDTTTGMITTIAGTNVAGFSGEGVDPLIAQFDNITAVETNPFGGIYIADTANHRVRYLQLDLDSLTVGDVAAIDPNVIRAISVVVGDVTAVDTDLLEIVLPLLNSVGGNVVADGNTSASVIDFGSLTQTSGDVSADGNTSASTIDFSSLTQTGGNVSADGNTSASVIDFSSLTQTSGDVSADGNSSASFIDFSSLTQTGGNVSADGNTSASVIDFSSLTNSGGDVTADGNTSASVIDFSSLTQTSGEVSADGNSSASFIDFRSLTQTGGNVSADGNTSASVIDFSSLIDVGGDFSVSNNSLLSQLSIAQLLHIVGSLSIVDNDDLAEIDLGGLTTVGGDVVLDGNTGATMINFSSVTNVGGSVELDGNVGATTIDFGSLGSVGGSVALDSNTGATTIDFGSMTDVGGNVAIDGNTGATVIDFGSLTNVGGNVAVDGNTGATVIDFSSLDEANGDLSVDGNTSVVEIGLDSLTEAGGDLSVDGNTSAVDIGLGSLVTTGGDLSVDGNTSAVGIGLDSLTEAGGNLSVDGNTSAVDIGLGSLATTGGGLSVDGNTSAVEIGLDSLTNVGGDLSVDGNVEVVSIGISSLANVGGDLSIDDNNPSSQVVINTFDASLLIMGDATLGDGNFDLEGHVEVVGAVNVLDGAAVDVDQSLTAATINIDPGGQLGGNGEIDGPVNNDGTVSPGNSPGTLTVAQYMQTADGNLLIQIGPTAHDLLAVLGGATLDGSVEFLLEPGYELPLGMELEFLTAGSIDGSFDHITFGDGVQGRVVYTPTSVSLVAVPEPGAIYLLALTTLALAVQRRREAPSS